MELFRALGAVCERPGPGLDPVVAALELPARPSESEFADLFGFQLYPYASVYLGAEGMLGGEARDRVAGFWRALRLPVPAEPDHLAALLGLYATLAESELAEPDEARTLLIRQSRKALLWEHLLSWLLPFLAKAHELAGPAYRRWAELLLEALLAEAAELGQPEALPLQLREAPPLGVGPETGSGEFLDAVLAPVQSGMVLVRDDLRRIADGLGLGLRVAERRYALRGLLEQDAAGTLRCLAREARGWAARHAGEVELTGEIAAFWRSRAEGTAGLLESAALAPA